MERQFDIIGFLNRKRQIENELSNMIYGTTEIRKNNTNKYIYVHNRENGRLTTKYIGEYSVELYNLILSNNMKVKTLKKELKDIDKELKKLNYKESELTDKVKNNIDFAKSNLVLTIYNQSILEGVATTFADTESIIEGGKVNNMTSDDVLTIINLKHAWEFVLSENVILSEENFYLLAQINKLILEGFYYNAGKIRTTPAKIGGTSWTLTIPIESQVIEELNNIQNKKISHLDKAIELLLYIMKRQIFINGNKRTAVIYANHHLISNGIGIIAIPSELTEEFKKLLIEYYEGKSKTKIKKFLKEKCFISL